MKLSRLQNALLRDLTEETENDKYLWCECYQEEWRTAKSLQKRGLIEIMDGYSDENVKKTGRFEARAI